jgi:hypothetical protein
MGTVAEDVFLVISNLALFPAIYYAFKKGYYLEVAILSVMFWASTIYHICLAGLFCISQLPVLQISDHFFVYQTLIWIALFFIRVPERGRVVLLLVSQLFLLPYTIQYMKSWWLTGIIIGVVALTLVVLVSFVTKRLPRIHLIDFLVLTVMLGVGFFLHIWAGEPGEKNYGWAHSLWHIGSMLPIVFIVWMDERTSLTKKVVSKVAVADVFIRPYHLNEDSTTITRYDRQVSIEVHGQDYVTKERTSKVTSTSKKNLINDINNKVEKELKKQEETGQEHVFDFKRIIQSYSQKKKQSE